MAEDLQVDNTKSTMVGHLLIRDVRSGEILVNQRDTLVHGKTFLGHTQTFDEGDSDGTD
jgi:hypothetical protein